jgi:hypothetical protein
MIGLMFAVGRCDPRSTDRHPQPAIERRKETTSQSDQSTGERSMPRG